MNANRSEAYERKHPDVIATSFHESGHAVAAIRSGLVLRSVDVKYVIGDRFGAADYEEAHAPLETRALCLLAAGAAERRYTGSRHAYDARDVDALRVLFRGSTLDPDQPYVKRHPGADAERQRIVDEWYAKAEAFVEREWMWIERVAQALQRHERLTGAEVKTLCSHPVVHIDVPPTVDEDARALPTPTPTPAPALDPASHAPMPENSAEEFLRRLGIPDVNADGVPYDGERFEAAHERYFDDPTTLTVDDLKQFAVVNPKLARIARAKQLGYVTPYTAEEQKTLKAPLSQKLFLRWVSRWMLPLLDTYRYKGSEAHARIDALERRVKALESRPALKYCGPYIEGQPYSEGSLITRKGGIWLATGTPLGTPGTVASNWRLIVKEGKAQ